MSDDGSKYTLGQLVEDATRLLEQCGPNVPVYSEGCDCSGPAMGLKYDGRVVELQRDQS